MTVNCRVRRGPGGECDAADIAKGIAESGGALNVDNVEGVLQSRVDFQSLLDTVERRAFVEVRLRRVAIASGGSVLVLGAGSYAYNR